MHNIKRRPAADTLVSNMVLKVMSVDVRVLVAVLVLGDGRSTSTTSTSGSVGGSGSHNITDMGCTWGG